MTKNDDKVLPTDLFEEEFDESGLAQQTTPETESNTQTARPQQNQSKRAASSKPAKTKAASSRKASTSAIKSEPAPSGSSGGAPSFTLVVVIVTIGIVLGFIMGYLAGAASENTRLQKEFAETMQRFQPSGQGTSGKDAAINALPEGHPDVSQMFDENGNVTKSNE